MSRLRPYLKSAGRIAAQISFWSFFLLVCLEILWRSALIGFYGTEYAFHNKDIPDDPDRPALLLLGDSFSASPDGYVRMLRDSLPGNRIYNLSLPGTGIIQARHMHDRYAGSIQPAGLIVQLYVGNDLFDIRYPSGGGLMRWAYWRGAERFRSLGWLNYKMGQRAATGADPKDFADDGAFSPDRYNARERAYLQAEPGLITNSACLRGGREQDMERLLVELEYLTAEYRAEHLPVFILVVPHCAQLSESYRERMRAIGADADMECLRESEYRFLQRLRSWAGLREGVRVVDPRAALIRAEADAPVYYSFDPHLNARGQAVLGREILRSIREAEYGVELFQSK